MGKKLSQEEVEQRIKDSSDGKVKLVSTYLSKGNNVTLQCIKCGHKWIKCAHRAMDDRLFCPHCNDKKKYYVYELVFPDKKRYIGMTSKLPKYRWDNGNGYKSQPVYKAICKFGWNNIKHNILYQDLSFIEAEKEEQRLILKYKTQDKDFGYNIEAGGVNGNIDKASCRRIAQYDLEGNLLTIYNSVSEAERKSDSFVSLSSINMCCLGKSRTAGGFLWEYIDDEKNIPIKIEPYYQYNKNGQAKEIIQLKNNKIIKIWGSLTEAAEKLNIPKSGICYALKHSGHYKDFDWRYKEEGDENKCGVKKNLL